MILHREMGEDHGEFGAMSESHAGGLPPAAASAASAATGAAAAPAAGKA